MRGWLLPDAGEPSVVGVVTRDGAEVGVALDSRGYLAAAELHVGRGAVVDAAGVFARLAADPACPSSAALRIAARTPPNNRPGVLPVARRAQVLVRLHPVRSAAAVTARGGGVDGSRAALTAALHRLRAWFVLSGIGCTVLDGRGVRALLADDLPRRARSVVVRSRRDLDPLVDTARDSGGRTVLLSLAAEFRDGTVGDVRAELALDPAPPGFGVHRRRESSPQASVLTLGRR